VLIVQAERQGEVGAARGGDGEALGVPVQRIERGPRAEQRVDAARTGFGGERAVRGNPLLERLAVGRPRAPSSNSRYASATVASRTAWPTFEWPKMPPSLRLVDRPEFLRKERAVRHTIAADDELVCAITGWCALISMAGSRFACLIASSLAWPWSPLSWKTIPDVGAGLRALAKAASTAGS